MKSPTLCKANVSMPRVLWCPFSLIESLMKQQIGDQNVRENINLEMTLPLDLQWLVIWARFRSKNPLDYII